MKTRSLVSAELASDLAIIDRAVQTQGGLTPFLRWVCSAVPGSCGPNSGTAYSPPIRFDLNNPSTFFTAFNTAQNKQVTISRYVFDIAYSATLFKVYTVPPSPKLITAPLVISGAGADHLSSVAYLSVTVTATTDPSTPAGLTYITDQQTNILSLNDFRDEKTSPAEEVLLCRE